MQRMRYQEYFHPRDGGRPHPSPRGNPLAAEPCPAAERLTAKNARIVRKVPFKDVPADVRASPAAALGGPQPRLPVLPQGEGGAAQPPEREHQEGSGAGVGHGHELVCDHY